MLRASLTFPCMRRRSVSVTPMAPSPNSCSQLMVVVVVWWVEVWVDSAAGRRMKVRGPEAYGAVQNTTENPLENPARNPWRVLELWEGWGEVGFGGGRVDGAGAGVGGGSDPGSCFFQLWGKKTKKRHMDVKLHVIFMFIWEVSGYVLFAELQQMPTSNTEMIKDNSIQSEMVLLISTISR